MTREELKNHCEKQIEMCEMWAIAKGEKPGGKVYEEHKLILELLEQEPCEDAISRAEALQTINNMDIPEDMSVFEIKSHIGVEIGTLPPVQPKPKTGHWIPASEKLPKTSGVYRVTRYYPNDANPRYIVDACYFDGSDTWYNDNRINHGRAYADNVIAWQENPEPYKPQESEKI